MSVTKRPEAREYYTYADYAAWDDDFRCELIDGVVYDMSAPSIAHQEVSIEITTQLRTYLRGKKCRVFAAPFDVRLNPNANDDIVVQPDISVVCDEKKLENGKHCIGAPDFIIEILSPSTSRKDKVLKSKRYFDAGVREYWIIDPEDMTTTVLMREEDNYTYLSYEGDAEIPVSIFDDCTIDMKLVFPPPPEEDTEELI